MVLPWHLQVFGCFITDLMAIATIVKVLLLERDMTMTELVEKWGKQYKWWFHIK